MRTKPLEQRRQELEDYIQVTQKRLIACEVCIELMLQYVICGVLTRRSSLSMRMCLRSCWTSSMSNISTQATRSAAWSETTFDTYDSTFGRLAPFSSLIVVRHLPPAFFPQFDEYNANHENAAKYRTCNGCEVVKRVCVCV